MYLPVGNNCSIASNLIDLGIRKCSYPYDWTINQITGLNSELMLRAINCTDVEMEKFAKEHFDRESNKTYIQPYNQRVVHTNVEYNVSYPHDDITDIKEKYLRRFKRMRDHFFTAKKVCIIFACRWERLDQTLLDFYNELNEYRDGIELYTINGFSKDFPLPAKYNGRVFREYVPFEEQWVKHDWGYDQVYKKKMKEIFVNWFK